MNFCFLESKTQHHKNKLYNLKVLLNAIKHYISQVFCDFSNQLAVLKYSSTMLFPSKSGHNGRLIKHQFSTITEETHIFIK